MNGHSEELDIAHLFPPPFGINGDVVPSFHSDNHLEPVRNGHIRFSVLGGKANMGSTVWDVQVALQEPRSVRIQQ
jgi:hypothetical protein